MKNGLILFWLHFSVMGFAQSDTLYNYRCNDQWLDQLIKNDTIYEENRGQDYMCYLGIFDSIEHGKTHTLPELYIAIGRLSKYSDGAFSEGLHVSAYTLFTKDPAAFFNHMKILAKESDYRCWALLLFYECRIRFDLKIKPHEIIEKLNIDEMLKSKKGYRFLEKYIYIIYAEHLKN